MYCTECGKQIEDTARFCEHCGAAVRATGGEGPGQKKSGKKWLLLLLVLLLVIVTAAVIYFVFFKDGSKKQAEDLMERGQHCLEEQEYEQAADAFMKTIEIDPQNADAYIWASTAYTLSEKYKEAVAVLEAGYAATEDSEIFERCGEVCRETARYYMEAEEYEEARVYIEKGEQYGGSEELKALSEELEALAEGGSTAEALDGDESTEETSVPEEEAAEARYAWVLEPSVEADDIYYLNSDDIAMLPTNDMKKQLEENFGYAVVRSGSAYGLIDSSGNLLDGMNYVSVGTIISNYKVTYGELHYEPSLGGEDLEFSYGDFGLDWALSYGAVLEEMHGGTYFWDNGLGKHPLIKENGMLDPETPVPVQNFSDSAAAEQVDIIDDWYAQLSGKYAVYGSGCLVTDFIYDECGSYSDGLMAVCQDGKWGYINGSGEVVIPIEYDASWTQYVPYENRMTGETKDFCYAATEGYVALCKGGQGELRDVQGGVVIPAGEFEAVRPVYDGKCWVKKDGKWGVIQVH